MAEFPDSIATEAVTPESGPARIHLAMTGPRRPDLPLGRTELARTARILLDALGLDEMDVEITVCGDAAMARLHRRHLGRTGPTNVLSFPADPDDPQSMNHVVLSSATLAREAVLYGQDPGQHLARLLAHAFLHLAGLPHGPDMEAMTEAALAAFDDAGG